ncbi:hypothetical protein [Janthinobacterium fluminis]|uniref:Big-1 domain-containing protein n=1 Tax=Janthinobacterium fluminis TaxID=2987524 RepID=A0ABT5K2X7_9BURK|nr:hypothetical protein [Janthinobacterium fluminis]MDC8759259.1 hypothetical protein [Janthinobacterium fluminis]
MFDNRKLSALAPCLLIGALTLLLNACGGGSGGAGGGCTTLDPSRDPSLPSCGTSTPGTTPASAALTLALTDAAGAATATVSPDRPGTVQALLKDSKGNALANVALTFITSDKSATLLPSSGTALTNASGVASIGLPAGSQAGAFTLTASASGAATASATKGYTVTFPTLTLGALTISPATLSAGGNASVSTTLQSAGAVYTPPQSVSFSSPCAAAGKATLSSPVLTANGVATASYTDKGCGVADLITATTTLAGATVSNSGSVNVLPATAGSLKFVSADTGNIALKGSGSVGRQEFSTLTFQVFDTTGTPVAGKLVDFVFADSNSASTVGGLTLNPASATSAADGKVTAQVVAGTIPTSVRVQASVRASTPLLTSLSNILVVSTGVPDQAHFSLSTKIGNCEGRDYDQECSIVTAALGDHFGNPVPDGTAVNFTTEGGFVTASCLTGTATPGSGACSVALRAGSPRPANGRVTVLAYALGEENFFDANGNNVFDGSDTFTDKSPDIFRDDNESGDWSAGEACVGANLNATCSTPGDGQYNGVLRNPQVPSAQTLYVSSQLVQIFSGSTATVTTTPAVLNCAAGGTTNVQVKVTDQAGNVMPAGSTIAFSALFGTTVTPVLPAGITVPNIVLGVGQPLIVPVYTVTMGCPAVASTGRFFVTVTTPLTQTVTATSFQVN